MLLTHCHFRHVRLFASPWTIARQAPPSLGVSRQEYWSGLPCLPPGGRTQVSYVSCIGRRVLYHEHHLGSWRQPMTRPKEEISTCLKCREQSGSPCDGEAGEPPGAGRPLRRGLWGSPPLHQEDENRAWCSCRPGARASSGQSRSGGSLHWRQPGGRGRNNPEFSDLCQQRSV